jgi:hypothetical protein
MHGLRDIRERNERAANDAKLAAVIDAMGNRIASMLVLATWVRKNYASGPTAEVNTALDELIRQLGGKS